MCVHMYACVSTTACVEIRGQLLGVTSLIAPFGSWDQNQAWRQVAYPTKPSYLPL